METQRQFRDDLNTRVRVLLTVVSLLLAVVASAFWYVQVVRGTHFREQAENNRLRRLPVRAPRGEIRDRDGELLVENTPSYNLLLDRSRSGDVDDSLAFASELLDRPLEELAANLERARRQPDYQPVPVARNLTLAQVARISALALEHPEFEIDVGHLRLYRHGSQVAHAVGYLGEVSERELAHPPGVNGNGEAPDYRPGDLVGKKGIERRYDATLRGEHGERAVVVDSHGRLVQEYGRVDAQPGEPLRLTLDLDLQQAAERRMRGEVGAVVALDPRDGAVLAMVSTPSFDPNLFARGIRPAEWAELVEDDRDPLQNRVLQNAHSPGSVFKMVMATAGLAEGVIDPGHRVYCPGYATIYGNRFRCWRGGGHGWVDLDEAVAGSCNVYFYQLGKELGIDAIERWARAFGFGSPTGIEVAGERTGVVPGRAWSLAERGHPWFPGETISVSIGQGPITATPLQVARAVAALANGGRLVTPHLVAGAPAAPAPRLPVGDEVLARVRRALAGVVEEGGTAYWTGGIDGLRYAGKTGTVQVVSGRLGEDDEDRPWKLRNHAWFASFAPLEEPELVLVVFHEHGGAGSTGAAPIARDLYRSWFGLE